MLQKEPQKLLSTSILETGNFEINTSNNQGYAISTVMNS